MDGDSDATPKYDSLLPQRFAALPPVDSAVASAEATTLGAHHNDPSSVSTSAPALLPDNMQDTSPLPAATHQSSKSESHVAPPDSNFSRANRLSGGGNSSSSSSQSVRALTSPKVDHLALNCPSSQTSPLGLTDNRRATSWWQAINPLEPSLFVQQTTSPTLLLRNPLGNRSHSLEKFTSDGAADSNVLAQDRENQEKLDARTLFHVAAARLDSSSTLNGSSGATTRQSSSKSPRSVKARQNRFQSSSSNSFPPPFPSAASVNLESSFGIAGSSQSAGSPLLHSTTRQQTADSEEEEDRTRLSTLTNDLTTVAVSLSSSRGSVDRGGFTGPDDGKLSLTDILKLLGPGWLVAMAYIDPGNLEGDLSAGALRSSEDPFVGYRLLWVLMLATLVGFWLQRLAIKLGTVTGFDLATMCRMEFPNWASLSLWVLTEFCLIGADMQAVIGSAIGLRLLFGLPMYAGILITLVDTFLVLLIDYCGPRKLEACFALLMSVMAGCFFVNMFTSQASARAITEGLFIISVPPGALKFTIALIGSVVMPHNFFLQSAVVQSRPIERTNANKLQYINRVYSIESFCLLFISLLVNVAVVVAFADPRIVTRTGTTLNLYNAHKALESSIGRGSALIWALGLLAAGQCSTMACTYAGQFIMEGLLGVRLTRLWVRVLVTRLTAILPLLSLVYFSQKTVEAIANWVNVLQAFCLPLTLVILLKFTASPKVMGVFALSSGARYVSYISGGFLVFANISLVFAQLGGSVLGVMSIAGAYLLALWWVWMSPIEGDYAVHQQHTYYRNLEAADLQGGGCSAASLRQKNTESKVMPAESEAH